jgi:hypothetical protein
MRTKIRSEQRVAAGPSTIEISTEYAEVKPGGPLKSPSPSTTNSSRPAW